MTFPLKNFRDGLDNFLRHSKYSNNGLTILCCKKKRVVELFQLKNYANWPVTALKQVPTKGAKEKLLEAEV